MSDHDPIVSELLSQVQEANIQGAKTATAVEDLTRRFGELEKKLDENVISVQGIKGRLSWAKGYVAGWMGATALAGSALTLLLQWAVKKFGGHP